jgi:SAM-dependent methyltransferase
MTDNAQAVACPICAAGKPELLDARPHVPIAQNLMYRSRDAALNCPQGRLQMVRCMQCGFAWNAAFDQALLTYDADYENDQSISPAFDRHLVDVAEAIGGWLEPDATLSVVEVGCGQGYFLHRLADAFGTRLEKLVGFDPAFRQGSPIPPQARVVPELFNEATCRKTDLVPDLIVTRHVIEHVPDPLAFLGAIREVARIGTVIAVETPNLQWILDGAVAHDFYYEHCSLFDRDSLRLAMEVSGFEDIETSDRLGGQYLLALGRAGEMRRSPDRASRPDNVDYPTRRAAFVDRWRRTFAKDQEDGEKIALWGGASKGVTLALLVGDCATRLTAIDINPARDGSFMPVSGVPVILPEKAQHERITKAYVVNPAYVEEVEQYCSDKGWGLRVAVVD